MSVRRQAAAGVLLLAAATAACTPGAGLSSESTPSPRPSTSSAAPQPTPSESDDGSACLTGGGGGSDGIGKIGHRVEDDASASEGTVQAASEGTVQTADRRDGSGDAGDRAAAHPPADRSLATEPSARAEPREDRPQVRLCFDVPADRRVVTGHETVAFTAERRLCEAVFRAWPNKPETAWAGNRLEVLGVQVEEKPVRPSVERAGAPKGSPGTLIRVPIPGCTPKGERVTVDLDFRLALGRDTAERVGYSHGDLTAWLATAYPLLAWESGVGWATEPAVELFGETVTSEVFELVELRVIAPSGDKVLGVGRPLGTRPGPRPGTTEHRFTAPAVRDVAVSVGRFEIEERTVDGVRLHVAALPDSEYPLKGWVDRTAEAVRELSDLFGPFPYDHLWVTIVPDIGTGIEFPGAIQFGDVDVDVYSGLVPHEVAHMWFYGLVGNNQARDPWLDESFAEYAEMMASGEAEERGDYQAPPEVRYEVGRSMSWYDRFDRPELYGNGVYQQGAAMLYQARKAVGAETFDRLLRDYIDANAHRIVTDDDVREAFASAPKALAVLERYGAFID